MNKNNADKRRNKTENCYILGIDTSCDDTSVAIIRNNQVLANVVSSQDDLHMSFGGVVPDIARNAHRERLPNVINEAFSRAAKVDKSVKPEAINAVAVTVGPGLAIALGVGIEGAINFADKYSIPLISVNHMEGHLLSALAANNKGAKGTDYRNLKYPALGVLISGGHTELVLINNWREYQIVAETMDDAMGEAYDKVARMLGLGFPGAKALTEMAKQGDPTKFSIPVPLKGDKREALSYSGLKTAVYYLVKKMKEAKPLTRQQIADIAAGFQVSAVTHLLDRITMLTAKYKPNTILLGGGVVSNAYVRKRVREFCKQKKLELKYAYTKKMFVDNAAMIALVGYYKFLEADFTEADKIDRAPRLTLTQFI